jgi:hypothetical protein
LKTPSRTLARLRPDFAGQAKRLARRTASMGIQLVEQFLAVGEEPAKRSVVQVVREWTKLALTSCLPPRGGS